MCASPWWLSNHFFTCNWPDLLKHNLIILLPRFPNSLSPFNTSRIGKKKNKSGRGRQTYTQMEIHLSMVLGLVHDLSPTTLASFCNRVLPLHLTLHAFQHQPSFKLFFQPSSLYKRFWNVVFSVWAVLSLFYMSFISDYHSNPYLIRCFFFSFQSLTLLSQISIYSLYHILFLHIPIAIYIYKSKWCFFSPKDIKHCESMSCFSFFLNCCTPNPATGSCHAIQHRKYLLNSEW